MPNFILNIFCVQEILYNNILEQIGESEAELRKCLTSFHIDYFVYKSGLADFARLFAIMTSDSRLIGECINDRRISRAYEACMLLAGDKCTLQLTTNSESSEPATTTKDECLRQIKHAMSNLGSYLVENTETIISSQSGIFALRIYVKVIGEIDELEQAQTQQQQQQQQQSNKKGGARGRHQPVEFSLKNMSVKRLPVEWKLEKFIKKLAKPLNDINLLGK